MAATDPFALQRFVDAQAGVFAQALAELQAGRKRTHWMWFVFPQLAGLGTSTMAQRYAIASLAEARAYLSHPVLGPRLRECCEAMAALPASSARAVLGTPDDMKFRSCLTLFERAAPADPLFVRCLDQYFAGERDARTPALLDGPGGPEAGAS